MIYKLIYNIYNIQTINKLNAINMTHLASDAVNRLVAITSAILEVFCLSEK